MAIHQIQRQTDLEKRLQLLRRQIYGKENKQTSATSPSGLSLRVEDYQLSDKIQNKSDDRRLTTESYSDIDYLSQDLRKILLFSSIAIGAQVILFILLQNHILRINFF